jgi:hypothetical protein
MELWLAIASTLAALSITPRGTTPPPAAFHTGIVRLVCHFEMSRHELTPSSHPVPFDCTIRPRDERTKTMVKNAVASLF